MTPGDHITATVEPARGRAGHSRREAALWLGAAVLVALALYANALRNPYVSDDTKIIAENPTLRHPGLAALFGLWQTDYWAEIHPDGRVTHRAFDHNLYRPVTMLTYWVQARFWGIAPWQTRLVNILLHAAAAVLIGWWCRGWLGRWGGAAAALFVLAHPVATDVMNKLVGRADILVLLGMGGFLAVQVAASRRGWSAWRTALAVAWAMIAVWSKESGAVLLPVAVAQAWVLHARDPRGARLPARVVRIVMDRGVIAIILVTAWYMLARFAVVGWPRYEEDPTWDLLANPMTRLEGVERLPASLALLWYYLRMQFWPWPLLTFDVPAPAPGWGAPETWAGVAVGLAALAATGWSVARRHWLVVAMCWWWCGMLLLGQWFVTLGVFSEARLVYPMLGIGAMLVGWAVASAAQAARRAPGTAAVGLAAALVLACGAAAWLVVVRNAEFRSAVTMMEADRRHRPDNAPTLVRCGIALQDAGRYEEAAPMLEKATELAPHSAVAWFQRATLYAATAKSSADRREALRCYERVLEIVPDHPAALMYGGRLWLEEGDVDRAEPLLLRAAEDPADWAQVEYCLAVVASRRGRWQEAVDRMRKILKADPAYPGAREFLDYALRNLAAHRK